MRAGSVFCLALTDSQRCPLLTGDAQASVDQPTRAHMSQIHMLHICRHSLIDTIHTVIYNAVKSCLWFERCKLLYSFDGVVGAGRRAVIHAAIVLVAHAGEGAWAAKRVRGYD